MGSPHSKTNMYGGLPLLYFSKNYNNREGSACIFYC